jgi:hypothetical protein
LRDLRGFTVHFAKRRRIRVVHHLHKRVRMNPIEFDRLIARARNPRLIPESTTVGRRAGVDLSKLGEDDGAANVRNAFEHHYDDPLVARSRDYARLSYPVSQALGPIVAARGD